ncbi:Coproporphyrinogen III oxidase family protein (plasmid) [Cupriavidus taiwanensis]|uniref:Coproporphyrinogen III oxidase family protein n=2 Tax=Burkholderiaceae TaxID=119060 RepID=A0A375FJG3_9BURK|nr:STM4012 family radical SAM protein [Cupriavidus taiwanensis]SOZ71312.1 Coproporphyrinogen III oxidase family protein [Cupriavidus taiwanensis]SOZ72368.1 Coproporphyrinogen III oxidase family protein [Cupriavidus taiwanensis]SOZ74693.1 Coproporphyrinogen III oxidase family protein [Cupriavidus taiwanensis]SPA03573.1 Coproporphyrinogen III oxidase family protein [Cupriavidus taiwanensis]SPA11472.1 Coproporphyrinogen III oxidase family protein [Cupriavidus taiwanensis]
MRQLANLIRHSISNNHLKSYVYSYPSKRSYKDLHNIGIAEIWRSGERGPVSIYIHIPFCRYRCTYCALFLTTQHTERVIQNYVDKICDQIEFYATYAGRKTVVSVYFGGGTPTILKKKQFEQIFSSIQHGFKNISSSAELCVEGSPDSISEELLGFLKSQGVNRISMGIQTMDSAELKASGRPYPVSRAISAIENIQKFFENFNLDLIYGLSGQTYESWANSLRHIVSLGPPTISLYSAVSRPLTAIYKQQRLKPERYIDDQDKYAIYDSNVEFMQINGYRQESFTRFTHLPENTSAYAQETSDFLGVPLIGIGAGARSYNGKCHYSFDYAVDLKEVSKAIEDYLNLEITEHSMVRYGIVLDAYEERLRYFILNLTLNQLSKAYYSLQFGRNLYSDFPEVIDALEAEGCIEPPSNERIRLTKKGYKYSNLVAHHLFSNHVKTLEERYVPR